MAMVTKSDLDVFLNPGSVAVQEYRGNKRPGRPCSPGHPDEFVEKIKPGSRKMTAAR